MARRRSQRMIVTKVRGVEAERTVRREPDDLIVEEPMSIQLDGTLVSTTMRTPGDDHELAAGFCFTEGLLGGMPIIGVRYCADGSAADSEFNVVTVETGGHAPTPTPRLGNTSSSCGWCGSDQLDDLMTRLDPLPPTDPISLEVIATMPDRVLRSQGLFDRTGAVHAAAAFTREGDVLVMREDVGRHNAVDKVIGAMLLGSAAAPAADPAAVPAAVLAGTPAGVPVVVPATGLGLFVSGRASIEMVQKAWAAGFSTVVAVSAPTALAVDAARRSGMVLAGFIRGSTFNVYAPERLVAVITTEAPGDAR